jgi:hypothetical protein
MAILHVIIPIHAQYLVVHTSTSMYHLYNYILVLEHTGTYWYIPVCTKYPDFVLTWQQVGIPDDSDGGCRARQWMIQENSLLWADISSPEGNDESASRQWRLPRLARPEGCLRFKAYYGPGPALPGCGNTGRKLVSASAESYGQTNLLLVRHWRLGIDFEMLTPT